MNPMRGKNAKIATKISSYNVSFLAENSSKNVNTPDPSAIQVEKLMLVCKTPEAIFYVISSTNG